MGFDLTHCFCDDAHVLKVVYACPLVLEVVIHHPLIDMTERQETERPVAQSELMCGTGCYSVGDQVVV